MTCYRPLPEEMFKYARSDTHFLLYIYDILRNELLEKSDDSQSDGDLINVVLRKSKQESLQRYERPIYDADHGTGPIGWYNLLCHQPALLNPQQFSVFRAVHQWRDRIARDEDESLHTVMPKRIIYNIAREMPDTRATLLGCSHPISSLVQPRIEELLATIKQAKAEGINGPELMQILRPVDSSTPKIAGSGQPSVLSTLTVAATSNHLPVSINEDQISAKLHVSAFWGSTFDLSIIESPKERDQSRNDSIRLALPLPQLTAEVFEAANGKSNDDSCDKIADPGARAVHPFVKARNRNDEEIFVVKQVGGPKKRKAAELEVSSEPQNSMSLEEMESPTSGEPFVDGAKEEASYEPTNGDQLVAEETERKAGRKARRKAKKLRRKQEQQQADQANGVDGSVAFDYENAPSVLHAGENAQARTGTKEAFNPYSKSLDAPKGMKIARKETAGKSFTFKG